LSRDLRRHIVFSSDLENFTLTSVQEAAQLSSGRTKLA